MYWDSDIAKWIETASYTLATHRDRCARAPDRRHRGAHRQGAGAGRLFQQLLPAPRAARSGPTCATGMSSICLGHLIEAAVAYNQATGKTRSARHRAPLCRSRRRLFGPGEGQKRGLLRPRGDRAGAGQARPADRRAALSRPRALLHRRARPAAALFRHRGPRARRRSGGNSGTRPTTTTRRTCRCASRIAGRRTCRARHVPLLRHGRSRGG